MYATSAYSEYSYAGAQSIEFVPAAFRRLATARTADPIVFLEIFARENNVTILEEVIEDIPTGGIPFGYASEAYASRYVPRIERETNSFLFATRSWTGTPEDINRPNQRAIPRLINGGRISRSSPVEATISKRGQRTIGDARVANADGALDYILTENTLEGGKIMAWLAEPGDSTDNWAPLYEAEIEGAEATRTEIILNVTTLADQLKRSLQSRRYTGGGGLDGDIGVSGKLKPTCWGEAWGVDPVLISTADRIYQVHDSKIQAIDWVREGGLDYTFTADFADYDDLALATLTTGQYATCLARGIFRIGTTLEGLVYPIRAGVKGDATGNGYVSSTGDILYRIARDRAFLRSEQVNIDGFNSLPKSRVGYYTNGSSDVSIEKIFDDLLGGVVAIYGVGRDASISITRMLPADMLLGTVNVLGDQIFDTRVEAAPYVPRVVQPYTYAPTWAPLNSNEIAGAADASTASRFEQEYFEDRYFQSSTAAIPPRAEPTLTTFFAEKDAAESIAKSALMFSARNPVPLRIELGRVGLLADIGRVVSVSNSRFASNFRGVVYEQEDDLGAAVTSRVVALG